MTVALQDGFLQIFDVDHGQCALLTIPGPAGTKRVMIDCGDAVILNGTGQALVSKPAYAVDGHQVDRLADCH